MNGRRVTNAPEPFAEKIRIRFLSLKEKELRERANRSTCGFMHWRSIALMYCLLQHYRFAALPCDLQFQGRLWKQANNFYCEGSRHRQIFSISFGISCEPIRLQKWRLTRTLNQHRKAIDWLISWKLVLTRFWS